MLQVCILTPLAGLGSEGFHRSRCAKRPTALATPAAMA